MNKLLKNTLMFVFFSLTASITSYAQDTVKSVDFYQSFGVDPETVL